MTQELRPTPRRSLTPEFTRGGRGDEQDSLPELPQPVPVLRLMLTAIAVLIALFGLATLIGGGIEPSAAAVPPDEPARREVMRLLAGVAAVAFAAILLFFSLLGLGRWRLPPPP